jgi:glycerol-3-phosphate dehydrogenase
VGLGDDITLDFTLRLFIFSSVETRIIKCEVLIFGGGIAGLWLLNRLLAQGRSAYLFENKTVGGEQTIASQGVIHGGLKYALNGVLNDASEAIAEMPRRWAESFSGEGELDLRAVRVLSDHQVLWSSGGIASQITSFFASKTLSSRASQLDRKQFPQILQNARYQGSVFQLNECVVEPASLLRALSTLAAGHLFSSGAGVETRLVMGDGGVQAFEVEHEGVRYRFEADDFVLAAGQGNEGLMKQLSGLASLSTQRRPLHQVCVKHERLTPFYAVALGASTKPPVVITTHYDKAGVPVWYLGGDLAETGVDRDEAEQTARAQKLLRELLPWLDLNGMEWRTHRVNRAEPAYAGGRRPPGSFCRKMGNVIVAWPSKLALAPALADDVTKLLRPQGSSRQKNECSVKLALPVPALAEALWDRLY